MSVVRSRWLLIYLICVLFALLMLGLPYLYAYRSEGTNYLFGGFLLNPLDGFTYLAKMYQGWQGSWRYTFPYTASTGDGAYLFVFYLALGHLARLTQLPLVIAFHLARMLAVGVLLLALVRFLAVVLPQPRQRAAAFALAALGSGMGWLAFAITGLTSDFWVAEAYPFLSSYANPHFPFSLAALLELFTTRMELQTKGKSWRILWVALLSLFLALLSPFAVILALMVIAALDLWQRRWLDPVLWTAALASAPLLLYDLWVVRADPILAGWNAQNLTTTPPLWDIAISFSPALLFAFPGMVRAWKEKTWGLRLLLIWVASSLVAIYLPFGLQRRFLLGLYVPLAVFAVFGIDWLANRLQWKFGYLASLLLLFSLPTNLMLFLGARGAVVEHNPAIYLSRSEEAAMDWLQANAPAGSLVLAGPETGLFIPAYTGLRVLYGHPYETVNAVSEEGSVVSFFRDGGSWTSGQIQDFLAESGVDYVFYGPRERALGRLPDLAGLHATFKADDVEIFAVSPLDR